MAHDLNGTPLAKGDIVTLECEVVEVQAHDEYCNCTIKTVVPMHPSENPTTVVVNTRQVVLQLKGK